MNAKAARRLLLAVVASGIVAALGLAGATAVIVRSDWLLGQIDEDPDSLFVAFTEPRASVLPGRVRFRTLTIRSRDANVEWAARLEDVTVDVALGVLLARRFRASSVRAATLDFRLRERLDRPEATAARLARYPEVVGYPDPPLREPHPRPVPPGDPWRVLVDDLRVAQVRRIWIDSWRWEGEGRLAGGFFLRPGLEAEVFASELAVERGTLHWGGEIVSRDTAGFVRAGLPRFDTQACPGNDVWKIMSGSSSLTGSLDAISFLAPEGGGAARLEGGGSVRGRVSMTDGRGGGRLAARLHNGRPLVALLPSGPPKWIAGLFDLHDFHASARVRIVPGLLAASPVRARAGSLSLDADWRQARGRSWGALLIRKGVLSLGLGLGAAVTPARLAGAPDWFEAEGRPGGLRSDQPRGSVVRVSR